MSPEALAALLEGVKSGQTSVPEALDKLRDLPFADLGFARADLLEAGLLRNPVLSLLFPLGPKQAEATLRFPIEVLWERPRRVKAAGIAVNRVAVGLEQFGLNLVADVKIGFVELALARDRAQLAQAAAKQFEEIQRITDARLRAGDISELEARTAAIDAARARQDAARAVFDVTVDLRVGSPTFGRWFGIDLTAENRRQIDIPPGFAHGFQALSESVEMQYKQTGFFVPSSEGTIAWNDADLAIPWPSSNPILSARDAKGSSLAEYLQAPAFRIDDPRL